MNRIFKRCLITGIGGSGGSYLAEHILKKKCSTKIFGFYRSTGFSTYLKKKHK
jgi:GDP-D-mannose dehydratase